MAIDNAVQFIVQDRLIMEEDRTFLLQKAITRRHGLEKDLALKEIAHQSGRNFFDVTGWLAEDYAEEGWGHVTSGAVLVEVVINGDGFLDPAYNVDQQGIFVNRGPGQAARIRLQNTGGMAPLMFSDAELASRGITVRTGAGEAVIEEKVPLAALTTGAKLRAIDVILNELNYQGQAITKEVIDKIAQNLDTSTDSVIARISP